MSIKKLQNKMVIKEHKGSLVLYGLLIIFILASIFLLILYSQNLAERERKDEKAGKETKLPLNTNLSGPALYRDSLKGIFQSAVSQMKEQPDTGMMEQAGMNGQMDSRLTEFYRLKDEINDLLKINGSVADLQSAQKKIEELQRLVDEWKNRAGNTEKENLRLNALLKKLMNSEENRTVSASGNPEISSNNKVVSPLNAEEDPVSVSRINLTAQNDKLQPTSFSEETNQLMVSFELRNLHQDNPNAEVQIVIIKPDGKVLKNSEWDMGTFETVFGRKIYSYKVKLELGKGESRKLNFPLTSDQFMKGNYIMQIYHDGAIIGRVTKSLS
jgi:hypothetical protein